MKKSKLIALLLALAMLVVLCACGTTAPVDVYRIGTGYH